VNGGKGTRGDKVQYNGTYSAILQVREIVMKLSLAEGRGARTPSCGLLDDFHGSIRLKQ